MKLVGATAKPLTPNAVVVLTDGGAEGSTAAFTDSLLIGARAAADVAPAPPGSPRLSSAASRSCSVNSSGTRPSTIAVCTTVAVATSTTRAVTRIRAPSRW